MHHVHGNLDALKEDEYIDNKNVSMRFLGMAGQKVSSWCGSKEGFLGRYHDYSNPIGVFNGSLDNKGNYNENGFGDLPKLLEIAPGETKEVIFIVGMKYDDEAAKIIARYDENENLCEKELVELKKFWHGKLEKFQV